MKWLVLTVLLLSACAAPEAPKGPIPNRPEPTAARAALEKACDQNGGCDSIVYIGGSDESENFYEIAVYVITWQGAQIVVRVALNEGAVVWVK